MSAPRVLRALFCGGLAVAALLSLRDVEEGGPVAVGTGDTLQLAAALVSDQPPARIDWLGDDGPDGRTSWLLSPGPAVPPLVLPVGTTGRLRVRPPLRPVAGRLSALDVTVDGAPGDDTVQVVWRDELGRADSVQAVVDTNDPVGRVRIGLRMRPARAGWNTWTVRAAGDSVEVGAWVGPERPVRVLALAGVPDWEARFALRALDEAGIDVDAHFDLGRVTIGPNEWAWERYDVVLLFGEPPPSIAADGGRTETAHFLDPLVEFVRTGGGVVIAPRPQPDGAGPPVQLATRGVQNLLRRLGLADSATAGPVLEPSGALGWALPPELAPLPVAGVRAATVGLVGTDPAWVLARAPEGAPLAAARAHGRGRAAVVGIAETWRWRMEGGATEAHRAWWRSWIEWAASGLRVRILVSAPDHPVATGSVARLAVEALDSGAPLPPTLRLERPDGSRADLVVVPHGPGRGEARFLAARPGGHRVSWPDGETGVEVLDEPGAPDPSERALLALSSGRPGAYGTPLPPGAPGPLASRSRGAPGLPLLLGALLAAAALAEWSLRRLRGGP